MRKSTLVMACLVGLMMFASCKKDKDPIAPTITVLQSEGYVTENSQIYTNDTIKIGFVVTGEELVELETKVTKDGTLITRSIESIDKQATYTSSVSISFAVTGTVTVTATVTDKAGQTASKSFNILVNEKPNEKFVGHYDGEVLATGHYDVNSTILDSIHEEFENRAIAVSLDLVAGENMYEVVGTCVVDDRTVTAKGTVDGDKVTFEAINDKITITQQVAGFPVTLPISMTYTVNGTLTNGKLLLDGTFEGSGEFNMIGSGTVNVEGTFGGTVDKNQ